MIRFTRADSINDYRQACELIRHYETWLGIDLSFQDFAKELESLSEMYGPPGGALLLAYEEGQLVGCVGLRDLGGNICEMKRMFVLPEYHGRGIGAGLLHLFIEMASQAGYAAIRLDTLPSLKSALSLYQKAGFREIAAYRFNPDPEALYLQLDLPPIRKRQIDPIDHRV